MNDRVIETLGIEEIKIKLLGRLHPPEAQGVDVVSPVAGNRKIERDRVDTHVAEIDQGLVFPPGHHEGIGPLHPGIRVFLLVAVLNLLAEKTVAVKEAVAHDRQVHGSR